MPSILNSDDGVVSGTSGLKSTGGNDGLLNIQSNGSTIVAVTGSGISVTGTVSQTGVSTFAAGTVSAPSITFTGDTNTGIFSPAADTIAFTEGGAEAMRIDSSGNVGIGTTSPATKLDVSGLITGRNGVKVTGALASTVATSTVFLEQDTSASSRILATGADAGTSPTFSTLLLNNAGGVFGSTVLSETGLSVRSLGVGGTTPSSSGRGITFPATQSASTDANTLDDYEEGTWTPTLYGSSSAGTTTYSAQQGYYTKIGRAVTINCYIQISAMTGTGELQLGGLPFSNSSVARAASSGMVNGLNWGGGTFVVQYLDTSNNYISIYYCGDDASWAPQNCVNESIGFIFSMSYIV